MDYEIHAAPWEVHFDMTQLLHTYPQEFFSYMTYDLVIGVLGGGALVDGTSDTVKDFWTFQALKTIELNFSDTWNS